jgi:hypothetical protein
MYSNRNEELYNSERYEILNSDDGMTKQHAAAAELAKQRR